jgi:TonB-dependent SusC/RagA subfamily outer membrane receptor
MSSSTARAVSVAIALAATSACSRGGAGSPSTTPTPSPEASAKKPNVVSSDAIESASGEPIEKILASHVAGVDVGRAADGSLTVHIRGITSWNGDNAPLYVVDGVPITPGPGGSLVGISPYDIASIEVLKDPAQTSLYGSRGANGVILIKTKKPGRP